MLRDFEPGERVAARLEISRGGMLRGRSAGVDVMGDGSLVAFAGGVGRRPLEPGEGETPFDAVRPSSRARLEPVKPQEVEIPKGSYAAGRRVRLPRGAEAPIRSTSTGSSRPRAPTTRSARARSSSPARSSRRR